MGRSRLLLVAIAMVTLRATCLDLCIDLRLKRSIPIIDVSRQRVFPWELQILKVRHKF